MTPRTTLVRWLRLSALLLVASGLSIDARQTPGAVAPPLDSQADRAAGEVLTATGVPSASLAIVTNGTLLYAHAYGDARVDPKLPATPAMRYSIGSISKQFTAAAILMLQEQGKLSLDDPVGKYVAGLARGQEVTIREVLSHTSGYQDFWPQDYVPPLMLQPMAAQGILDRWARRPLDFDPDTEWQYSNTNYVIAGLVVEKVAGMPLWTFLGQRIFTPLGMTSITNTDDGPLPATDPRGYFKYALGPSRPAPKEGRGWMFAAGELAMTPSDLAKWNISMIKQSVLKPASYREMETEVRLKNGLGTSYGLGLHVGTINGHREVEHSGEVSGFTAENIVLPEDQIAVTVLTNQDAASAASQIAGRIVLALLDRTSPYDVKQDALARRVFDDLRQGRIDRALFTDNANAYFTDEAVRDYAASLAPLGPIEAFTPTGASGRGGMIHRTFLVRFAKQTVGVNIYEMPDGTFEQYLVAAR